MSFAIVGIGLAPITKRENVCVSTLSLFVDLAAYQARWPSRTIFPAPSRTISLAAPDSFTDWLETI